MKILNKFYFGAMIFAGSVGVSVAGSSVSGNLTQLASLTSGMVIFTAGAHSGAPACAAVSTDWAIDTTTPEGKAAYAILLTAVVTDKPVTVTGAGDCNAWPDRERAQQVFLGL